MSSPLGWYFIGTINTLVIGTQFALLRSVCMSVLSRLAKLYLLLNFEDSLLQEV